MRSLITAVVIAVIAAVVATFLLAAVAKADGQGSPEECLGGNTEPNNSEAQVVVITDASPITGVCVKAGQLHTDLITQDGVVDCYLVSGLGSNTVTITQLERSSECQAISHVDVTLGTTTPTPTTTRTPTSTPTPTTGTPTGTPTSTPTPTPTEPPTTPTSTESPTTPTPTNSPSSTPSTPVTSPPTTPNTTPVEFPEAGGPFHNDGNFEWGKAALILLGTLMVAGALALFFVKV